MTSIAASFDWLLALVSGPFVTFILTIAVALIGYLMLLGQFPVRRAAFAILGAFILIGSGQIAQSLFVAIPQTQPLPPALEFQELPERELGNAPPPAPSRRGNPFDPYSGDEPVN